MKKLILKISIISILILNVSFSFMYKTGSTEIGVKINKLASFWGKNAVSQKIAQSSRVHFWIPFLQDFHVFDVGIQSIEMTFDPRTGDLKRRDDLLFKTIDGNDISLDVIIQYRIIASKAPYILQYVAADDNELKHKIIRSFTRSIPRDIFGELKTEEFYEQLNRQAKAVKVKKFLNEIVEPYGIIIENVLPKDYRFNPAYQKAIEDKKVADQLVEKNRSAARATLEEYRKKLEEVKGEVNKLIAQVDGEFKTTKIEADAYYDKQKAIAKAIRYEGEAEAKAIRARNNALASAGGAVQVQLEIAKALQNKKIIILPSTGGMNLRTMDVNDLLKVYGVKSVAQPKK